MKTLLLSVSFIFISLLMEAQVWAPSGATWHYEWAAMWTSGYVKINYTGDTVVDGKSCKILKKERFTYDWVNHIYSNMVIGYECTYLENNIVYYYRYGQFFKLYDFNSVSNDSWKIAGWDSSQLCGDTAIVFVDNTGFTTINSISLKYLKVSPGPNSYWAFSSDTIIERIGSLGYMFPEPICVVDLFEGGSLRCYYDDSFGLYERGSAPACDYITGVEDNHPERNFFNVYPVPATSIITLEYTKPVKGKSMIEIFDILGNSMKKIATDRVKLIIDVEDLKSGIYFISVTDQSGFNLKQRIIKNVP
jgi:Secretion system C-terminal sorting domain